MTLGPHIRNHSRTLGGKGCGEFCTACKAGHFTERVPMGPSRESCLQLEFTSNAGSKAMRYTFAGIVHLKP